MSNRLLFDINNTKVEISIGMKIETATTNINNL